MTVVLMTAFGCNAVSPDAVDPLVPHNPVPIATGPWMHVAWQDAGIFLTQASAPDFESRVVIFDRESAVTREVDLVRPSDCLKFSPNTLQRLSNSSMLTVAMCQGGERVEVDVIDSNSLESHVLVGKLKGAGWAGWNPTSRKGVTELNSVMCSSITFLSSERGAEARPVPVGRGGHEWSLATFFEVEERLQRAPTSFDPGTDCEDAESGGLAVSPALQPGTDMVTLFVSNDAIGKRGTRRSSADFDLWTMTIDGDMPMPVVDGSQRPSRASWSPNGRCLAFHGERQAVSGWWVWRPGDAEFMLMAAVSAESGSWSPDGSEFVSVGGEDTMNEGADLTIFDLNSIPQLQDCRGDEP